MHDIENATIKHISELYKHISITNSSSSTDTISLWFLHLLSDLYCHHLHKDTDIINSILPRQPNLTISSDAQNIINTLHSINWHKVTPEIFGTALQLCESDAGRSLAGMHYTSEEDILKLINPLFLDSLKDDIKKAGDDTTALEHVLKTIRSIRLLDPTCGSGNFLIVAYRQLRELESDVLKRLGRDTLKTSISLHNFYGIEYHNIPACAARISLIISAWQFGDEASAAYIIEADSLRIDWKDVCPAPRNDNESVYIIGNPPFLGRGKRNPEQQASMEKLFKGAISKWKSLDYVASWFYKAANYIKDHKTAQAAFVSTNSVCQGESVPALWPHIIKDGVEIGFAYRSFKWKTHTASNVGVVCVIVGLRNSSVNTPKHLYMEDSDTPFETDNISAYLTEAPDIYVQPSRRMLSGDLSEMFLGNVIADDGHLLLSEEEKDSLIKDDKRVAKFIKRFTSSYELMHNIKRYCLWITDEQKDEALSIPSIRKRVEAVKRYRLSSSKEITRNRAKTAYKFTEIRDTGSGTSLIIPRIISKNYVYFPADIIDQCVISSGCFVIPDGELWNLALITSRLHTVWIGVVCIRLQTDFSYSNTFGWNTFPVPKLSEKNLRELTQSVENIFDVRKHYQDTTLAKLYKEGTMPDGIKAVHKSNDELVETIIFGKVCQSDEERLSMLLKAYDHMINSSS